MAEIGEVKRCLVFALDMREKSVFRSTNLYAFDDFFVEVKNDETKSGTLKDKLIDISVVASPVDKLIDISVVASPVTTIQNCYNFTSFASINSIIYRVGGSYYSFAERVDVVKNHARIFKFGSASKDEDYEKLILRYEHNQLFEYCDMLNHPCNWEKGPDLNLPRGQPHLLVLGGKLYAAGGLSSSREDFSFMEVLDEEKKSWVTLPNPPAPVENLNSFLSASVDEMGYILIVTYGEPPSAFTYTPDDGWEPFGDVPFDPDMVFDFRNYPAVVVGKVLLWTDVQEGTYILGLDLEKRDTFCVNVVEEGLLHTRFARQVDFPRLVHLGEGELCLFWRDVNTYVCRSQDGNNEDIHYTDYRCVKFRIRLGKTSPVLKVISRQKCIAPAYPHKFRAAFAVDVMIPKNKRSRPSIPFFTGWGFWGSLSLFALIGYFQVTKR